MTGELAGDGQPQGHARPHRLDQGDAEDHQGHADGRGVEAAPRAGGGGSRAALCRAHGEGAGQHRLDRRRHQFGAEAAGRHRAGSGASAGGLHRRARPVRRVQLVDRAARARADQCADRGRQDRQDSLRRPQGRRAAPPAIRGADHRGDRAARARRWASSTPIRSATRSSSCSRTASSTSPRCSSRASSR